MWERVYGEPSGVIFIKLRSVVGFRVTTAYCRKWVLVCFSWNKAAIWALYTGACKPKGLLSGKNILGSSWELEQEKSIISDVGASHQVTCKYTMSLCFMSWIKQSLLSSQTKGFLHFCERAWVTCPGWMWRVLRGHKRITLCLYCAFSPATAPGRSKGNVSQSCLNLSSETS